MTLSIPDYRLPSLIEPNAKGGPEWDTDIHEAVTGTEQRNQRHLFARHRYTLSIPPQYNTEDAIKAYKAVRYMFNKHRGQLYPFRFLPPGGDGVATDERFGTGDGATTAFQLGRIYDPQMILLGTPGTNTYFHPIYLVEVGTTPIIKVATVVTAPASISETQLVTFSSPPANGAALTWTGIPNLPVRFAVDRMQAIFKTKDISQIGSFDIIEVLGTAELLA